jgi:hypothetical protein
MIQLLLCSVEDAFGDEGCTGLETEKYSRLSLPVLLPFGMLFIEYKVFHNWCAAGGRVA